MLMLTLPSPAQLLSNFLEDEGGATAIEYGLIAALIAVVIIASLTVLGYNLERTFGQVASSLSRRQ
jgi:pilus assembly protein Flp/PilA